MLDLEKPLWIYLVGFRQVTFALLVTLIACASELALVLRRKRGDRLVTAAGWYIALAGILFHGVCSDVWFMVKGVLCGPPRTDVEIYNMKYGYLGIVTDDILLCAICIFGFTLFLGLLATLPRRGRPTPLEAGRLVQGMLLLSIALGVASVMLSLDYFLLIPEWFCDDPKMPELTPTEQHWSAASSMKAALILAQISAAGGALVAIVQLVRRWRRPGRDSGS